MRSAIWQRCSPWLTSSSGPSGAGASNCGCSVGGRERRRVVVEVECLDRHDVPLDREGAEQELGEAPAFVRLRIGPAVLGDVAGDAGERDDAGGHHLVHAGRGREEPGEVADGELDAVENLGKRDQLAELGQAAERLHAADHGIERLPVAGRRPGASARPGRARSR